MNDKELKTCSSFWKTNNEESYRRNFQGICTLETGAEAHVRPMGAHRLSMFSVSDHSHLAQESSREVRFRGWLTLGIQCGAG